MSACTYLEKMQRPQQLYQGSFGQKTCLWVSNPDRSVLNLHCRRGQGEVLKHSLLNSDIHIGKNIIT